MKYPAPLIEGRLLRRYKRFLSDVRLPSGEEVVAHCPNSGRMTSCWEPGIPCRVSHQPDPSRKLKWSLEQTYMNGVWVVVNTMRPNHVVEEAIASGWVSELSGYTEVLRERRLGKSRMDLLLSEGSRRCWVEVKNVTLAESGFGRFPDAVSTRATKHVQELAQAVEQGDRAVLFFHVGRADIQVVTPADAVDPVYAAELRSAAEAGVELLAYRAEPTETGITVSAKDRIPVDIRPATGAP